MIEVPEGPVDRVVANAAVVSEPAGVMIILGMTVAACRRCVFEDLRNVTVTALLPGVLAKQRKSGQIVIEEHVFGPSPLVVTISASSSLRAVVWIVRRVAGVATGFKRHVEDRFDMTRFASRRGMLAQQFVTGIPGMLETDVRPFGRGMTGLTGLTEMTVVIVVSGVAADTFRRQRVRKGLIAVAVAARKVRVRAVQRETGIARVVKRRVLPSRRVMAVAAFGAAAPLVNVVVRVAIDTRCRCRCEGPVAVAVETACVAVPALEDIAGRGMVEVDIGPSGRGMTAAALLAQRALVHLVVMAGMAGPGCVPVLFARLVAVTACHINVSSVQCEIGVPMVKRRFVENHDLCIPAFVIRMAARTRIVARIAEQAMEAATTIYVVGDVLVAVETQLPLLVACECDMAIIALGFDVFVSDDDFAGHHKRFYLGRCVFGIEQHQRGNQYYGGNAVHQVTVALVHVHREDVEHH